MRVKTPLKLALCKLFLSVISRHNLQNTKTFVTLFHIQMMCVVIAAKSTMAATKKAVPFFRPLSLVCWLTNVVVRLKKIYFVQK